MVSDRMQITAARNRVHYSYIAAMGQDTKRTSETARLDPRGNQGIARYPTIEKLMFVL